MVKPRNVKDWIFTASGTKFYPLRPRLEDIDIEWIAHSLSNLCRFVGHVTKFYSVAQHSVLVSHVPQPWHFFVKLNRAGLPLQKVKLACLLHDSSEGSISDIARPVKYIPQIAKAYLPIEDKIQRCVYQKFGVPWRKIINDEVKRCDNILSSTEVRDLIKNWDKYENYQLPYPTLPGKIRPLGPKAAKKLFLKRFDELISNPNLREYITCE